LLLIPFKLETEIIVKSLVHFSLKSDYNWEEYMIH